MTALRMKPPFWKRNKPKRNNDIVKLRPASLPKSQRFETPADTLNESERSQLLLGQCTQSDYLADCRGGFCQCKKPYCPLCAREFRRWFIGEMLRIVKTEERSIHIMTLLLKATSSDEMNDVDLAQYSHMLRKRLDRSGMSDAMVIGGFEVAYKAKLRSWFFHINLVVIGGTNQAIARFEESFEGSELSRPTLTVALNDLPEQLSYVLKFCTYHRPFQQRGPKKSPAVPLNRKEHLALVQWMHQREFADFILGLCT